jgi:CheY-like chemotaxis protein
MSPSIPVIAIFHSSDDISELLRDLLERAGFAVVSAHVDDVRRGRSDVKALMEQHDPFVIVYDLIPPFARHWQFVQHLRQTPQFKQRTFVYTSANADAARELGGHDEPVIELKGVERDFNEVIRAVKLAANREEAAPDD